MYCWELGMPDKIFVSLVQSEALAADLADWKRLPPHRTSKLGWVLQGHDLAPAPGAPRRAAQQVAGGLRSPPDDRRNDRDRCPVCSATWHFCYPQKRPQCCTSVDGESVPKAPVARLSPAGLRFFRSLTGYRKSRGAT